MKYTKNNPLRVVTLCSGYDSQCLALDKLKKVYPEFDYDLVAWAECDPTSKQPIEKQPAVIAHNALFPQWADRNLGDITKIDWTKVDDFDLLFYSTPCTDVSAAGLQYGFDEGSGTRSSIIWNVRDAIKEKRPKYLCLENVKNMVSKKFLPRFNVWKDELSTLGYANFAQIMNAKHYGVPQNRERIFLVSIRVDALNELEDNIFYFPKPFPLERRLKDMLEDNVDKKYYLSNETLDRLKLNGSSIEDGKTKNYIGCALRGRGKTDENSKNSQHLEINSDEYSNTITTVQKDYIVIEYEENNSSTSDRA